MRRILPCLLLLLPLSGCSSLLTTRVSAPVYYQLAYPPAAVSCSHSFSAGVRVLDFATAVPFDRPEMVAVHPGGEVRYATAFQWVDTPGRMLAETLQRDLSAGTLFPLVLGGNAPVGMPLELTGRVFRFAWVRQGKTYRGELKVEVTLLATGPPLRVLFHHTYALQSSAGAADDSARFAAAMSELAGRFSRRLQHDLCATAGRQQGE